MSSALGRWFGRQTGTGGWITDRHRGSHGERDYAVYVPAGRWARRRRPVVLLLHGCRQVPSEFAEASRLTAVAERHGLLLVAPEQGVRDHTMRCWRWYERRNQTRDGGEPALLAGLIAAVLAEPARWRADPTRVYAVGLSAGGAMALTLAATYPDVFAAVGVHSAPPHRSADGVLDSVSAMAARTRVPAAEGTSGMAPAVVFHGTEDTVVHPRNAERVVHQWLDHWATRPAGPTHPDRVARTEQVTGPVEGRHSTVRRWYTARGHAVLEWWEVDGLGHAWSGGLPQRPFSDPHGPSASTQMWRFLCKHSLCKHSLAKHRLASHRLHNIRPRLARWPGLHARTRQLIARIAAPTPPPVGTSTISDVLKRA